MKKITLLFTLLCVSTLNGMKNSSMQSLPPEIQMHIITYINEYNNLDYIVNAIKSINLVDRKFNKLIYDAYGNQSGFTMLAHTLANKFKTRPGTIAWALATPAAKQYLGLSAPIKNSTSTYLKIIETSAIGALFITFLLIFVK